MSIGAGLHSFRGRILLIVLGSAVFPLLILGVWLTRDVASSGEAVVRGRLEASAREAAERIHQRWALQRSLLLDVVEGAPVRAALRASEGGEAASLAASADLAAFQAVRIRHPDESTGLAFVDTSATAEPGAFLAMLVPVHDGPLGEPMGTVEAHLPVAVLLPSAAPAPGGMGALLGIYEAGSLDPLLPLPFEWTDTLARDVSWGGERWLTTVRRMSDPGVILVAAAPVSPFADPFREAAREGMSVVAAVGLGAFLLALLLTSSMTRSLGMLAAAAEAVAGGDLQRVVPDAGQDEVSRVARAFNRMTVSLRMSLRELADHRALAAVGEFAASLAHEIRNPLSAVRLDLQVVEEELPAGSRARRLQQRALAEIGRMDATLSGALQTARSGRWNAAPVPLDQPLDEAVRSVGATLAGRAVTITRYPGPSLRVMGDSGALRQLFLNLLLNACEAAGSGGHVEVGVTHEGGEVVVDIRDDGPGVPDAIRDRVFEPLVSGRSGGTGLGLPIAERIARAHGGGVEFLDGHDRGTVVRLRLPVSADPPSRG